MATIRQTQAFFIATVVGLGLLGPVYAQSFKPKNGFVPDEETAIRVAVAIWEPIYGKDAIARQMPYRAVLSNGVWTVTGSLPPNFVGGVAVAEISQADAKILRVNHGLSALTRRSTGRAGTWLLLGERQCGAPDN